ncbi:MAG: Gfo/Idh/MocA family oxidoreductase [Chloroflexota bacterium]
MSVVRFGVIGCVEHGLRVCEAIVQADNAELTMITDPRQGILDQLTEFFPTAATTSPDEVLGNREVDAVFVGAPLATRAQIALRVIQAGKHVMLANPMAATLEELDALAAAAERAGVKLSVALDAQVDAAAALARDYVRAGVLGPLVAWRVVAPAGDDVAGDLLRQLNAVLWVGGVAPTAVLGAGGSEALSGVVACGPHCAGTVQTGAALVGSAYAEDPAPRLYGTQGQIILGAEPRIFWQQAPEGALSRAWAPLCVAGPRGDVAQIIARFAQAILEDAPPPVGVAQARQALEVVTALRRSALAGRAVALPLA